MIGRRERTGTAVNERPETRVWLCRLVAVEASAVEGEGRRSVETGEMSLGGGGRRRYYDVQICYRLRSVNPWESVGIRGLLLELECELREVASITYHNMRGRRWGSGCDTKLAALLRELQIEIATREDASTARASRNVAGMRGFRSGFSPCIRLTPCALKREGEGTSGSRRASVPHV